MESLFTSGRVVDIALAVLVLEMLVLILIRHRAGRGPRASRLLPNALAGAGLLVALRAALTGAPWPLVAGPLGLALLAHVADVHRRWRDLP